MKRLILIALLGILTACDEPLNSVDPVIHPVYHDSLHHVPVRKDTLRIGK